jgi:hypothetical protein
LNLARHNPVDIEHALRAASPAPPPFPPATDRVAWHEIREELGEPRAAALVAEAQAQAGEPVPPLPATLYLDFRRTGQRERYQEPFFRRRRLLGTFALAECLTGEGRFLDPLLDLAWAICEESSWAFPAHQSDLADMDRPVIDLAAAVTALDLAELDALLGARLDPALGARIRYEVDRRCLTPYLTRHDHWWLYHTRRKEVNNWTAVCNAGVVGAATYLEPDPARLARLIAQAARSLADYLATFDPDGGTSEGPGYWSYGFGHYVVLAHLVAHRTGGQVDLLDGEQIRRIAGFPLRTLLSPDRPVTFSDCDPAVGFRVPLLAYLARRLDLPDLMRLARDQTAPEPEPTPIWTLRGVAWRPSSGPTGAFVPNHHDWYRGLMWMIARRDPADPDALVLAAKGGHNDELHNQNDVGAIIVHVAGESVIADIGRGRYTRAYFGTKRYQHLANSSLGHSVPVPNGQSQPAGREYAASVREHRADVLELELAGAYPAEADLASLVRRVVLHREPAPGSVELVDTVAFATRPGTCESVLITLGEVELAPAVVTVRGERGAVRITFEPATVRPRLEVVEAVDMPDGPADVRRICFGFPEPVRTGTIRLTIEPADPEASAMPERGRQAGMSSETAPAWETS